MHHLQPEPKTRLRLVVSLYRPRFHGVGFLRMVSPIVYFPIRSSFHGLRLARLRYDPYASMPFLNNAFAPLSLTQCDARGDLCNESGIENRVDRLAAMGQADNRNIRDLMIDVISLDD